MKRISASKAILFFMAMCLLMPGELHGKGGTSYEVPRVIYSSPKDGSEVDLSGKEALHFEWQMVPIPSGGRDSYRFTLYKKDGYEVLFREKIDSRTFSIDIKSEKFENETIYRWSVKQRDAKTMIWSNYDTWYFKVIRK